MNKEENVIKYYMICNKLKYVIRTGWLTWNVNRERLESVAEHVYGTQMLALAMYSEYNYEIDIMKVIFMLAIHELGECVIGDLTMFQIDKEEKEKIEHEAVHNILKDIMKGEDIESIFLEFDEHNTEESKFAYFCDKLECDIQSRIYDLDGCVNLNKQVGNLVMDNEDVKRLLDQGKTFSEMFIEFGQKKYGYDENFNAVSNYVKNNKILLLK